MQSLVAEHGPEVVFHAAAYKHVPVMEGNAHEAVKNNILRSHIAGSGGGGWLSKFRSNLFGQAVNPTSVMGATKRIGELIVVPGDQFNAVRFGAVRQRPRLERECGPHPPKATSK